MLAGVCDHWSHCNEDNDRAFMHSWWSDEGSILIRIWMVNYFAEAFVCQMFCLAVSAIGWCTVIMALCHALLGHRYCVFFSAFVLILRKQLCTILCMQLDWWKVFTENKHNLRMVHGSTVHVSLIYRSLCIKRIIVVLVCQGLHRSIYILLPSALKISIDKDLQLSYVTEAVKTPCSETLVPNWDCACVN